MTDLVLPDPLNILTRDAWGPQINTAIETVRDVADAAAGLAESAVQPAALAPFVSGLGSAAVLTTASTPVAGLANRYNATAGALAPVLPALSTISAGPAEYYVEKDGADTSTNAVTVTCAGSDKFENGTTTTKQLVVPGEFAALIVVTIGGTKFWKVKFQGISRSQGDLRYVPQLPPVGPHPVTGRFHLSAWISDLTGATDQTTQLQAAVTAAAAVYTSSGQPQTLLADRPMAVKLTTITWPSGVSLDGNNRILRIVGTSTTAPAINGSGFSYASPLVDVTIERTEFDGSTVPYNTAYFVAQKAIALNANAKNVNVRDCYVHDWGATGIATDYAVLGCHVTDNLIVNCGRFAGTTFTVTGVSGAVMTVSANPVTAGVVVGMVANNFLNGLTVAAYASTGYYPIYVSAVSTTTITLSVAPTGTTGTFTVNTRTVGGGSGIGVGTGQQSIGVKLVPLSGAAFQYSLEPQHITGNTVLLCNNYGIFHETQFTNGAYNGAAVLVSGNICIGNGTGIGLCGTQSEVCEGNTCIGNSTYGISVDGGTLNRGSSRTSLITGNTCEDNWVAAIALDLSGSVSGYPHGYQTVTDNVLVSGRGQGILVLVGTVDISRPIRISGNTIDAAGLSGIAFVYASGGTATVLNADIYDNQIYNCGFSTAGPGILIAVPMTNCRLDNNRSFNDTNTTSQTYGLTISAAFTGGWIRDNYLQGQTGSSSVGSNISATTWVSRNVGLAAAAPASVSVTASPMTYTAPAFPTTLSVVGGTVSAITVAGTTVAASTGQQIPLGAGDSVVLTYSSAPTLASRAA